MDYSRPGLPVLHHLSEFAQAHVHRVSEACPGPSFFVHKGPALVWVTHFPLSREGLVFLNTHVGAWSLGCLQYSGSPCRTPCPLVILFGVAETWIVHFPLSALATYPDRKCDRGVGKMVVYVHRRWTPSCSYLCAVLTALL